MSSGVFRGKESSNRIELSRLVQDLLNFGVLGSLWLWGVGGWVDGGVGRWVAPHTCTHACMHAHTHVKKLQMATSMFIKIVVSSPSSLSFPLSPCYPVIPTLSLSSLHHPQPPFNPSPTPTPTQGGPPNQ